MGGDENEPGPGDEGGDAMDGTGKGEMSQGGAEFEIRVRGTLDDSFREAFGELTVTPCPAETALRGAGMDQATLYGILDRIQSLGLELLEVRRLPPADDPGASPGTD